MRRLGLALLVLLGTGCPPKYPKCDGDKDCHPGEFCVDGQCQQCRNADDCAAGQVCKAGRCETPAAKRCTEDSQCPSGTSCVEGTCRKCKADDECGAGGSCERGVCKRAKAGDGDGENHAAGPCKLEPVYFDYNDFDLAGDSAAQAERDAQCLKKAGDKRVDLVGHTDPRGTEEYNLALSDRRAQAVKQYLQRLGIDPTRLRPVPKGELEAVGTDESGWVKDRRVDVQW